MNVFFSACDCPPAPEKIKETLTQILEKQFSGFKRDPDWRLKNSGNEFCLKNSHGRIWGKVYNHSFSKQEAQLLKKELECLSKELGENIQRNVFFPKMDLAVYPKDDLANYFRYSFIQGSAEKTIVVERLPTFPAADPPFDPEFFPDVTKGYQPCGPGQLSREELSELIELSLDLQRIP